MTFRILSVLLCLLAPAAAALAAPLSAQDEARVLYLEKRLSDLDSRDRELRAYADKAAKGEADGVKDIAAAQTQAVKEALGNNFNYLLGAVGTIVTLLIGFSVFSYVRIRAEAREVAKTEARNTAGDEARKAAAAELARMEGELNDQVASLAKNLETKEQEVLDALQKEAALLIEAIKAAEREAREYAQAAGESRDKADKALSDMANHPSRPVLSPEERQESERLKKKTKDRPPQNLTKKQLVDLTKQALADGQPIEAARYAGALVGKAQDDPYALVLLARSRLAQGSVTEAIDASRLAIEVAQARQDPRAEGVACMELGDALQKADRLQEAKVVYGQSRAASERLMQGDPKSTIWPWNLALVWSRLGDVLQSEGDRDGAKAAFTHSRDLLAGLLEKDETRTDWQRELAVAWGRVGEVLHDEGDLGGAKLAFMEDRGHLVRLVERDPTQAEWAEDLAVVWSYLGDLFLDEGDRENAKLAFTECRDRMTRLTEQAPTNGNWRWGLAVAWGRLADMLLEEGVAEEARTLHRQECEIFRQLAQEVPNDSDRQRDLAAVLRCCARSTLACGDSVGAASLLEEAEKIIASLLADAPANPLYRQGRAWIQGVRGDYHAALGNDENARRLWQEAVAELTALEEEKTLNFLGQRALKEYRGKVSGA